MTVERRTDIRVPIVEEVLLSLPQGFRLCKLHDISFTGALLNVYWGALTRGAKVDLMITLSYGDEEKVFHIPSEIARITDSGTAIHFLRVDPETHEALEGLIEHGIQHAEDKKPGGGPPPFSIGT
ncbi:MAG: PilZ domain-containing protein [Acidiferrobacteraceae bacterium]|jgi:hypothetical protein